MTVLLSPLAGAGWQFFNNDGVPLAGGKIYTYAAGTSTPQATYTTQSGSIANSNPIILDSAGRPPNEVWLTNSTEYKFVLNDSAGNLIGTYDDISGINDVGSYFVDLQNSSDPAKGDALVGFRQSNASGNLAGSYGKTVHQKFQEYISILDFIPAGTNTATTDCTAYIQAAENYCATSGNELYWPPGTYKCLTGLTKKAVNWHGCGKYKTILAFYGSGVFINATGTSNNRVICNISDMEFNGTNANANAVGITVGWNQRSTLLSRIHIFNFGHYGIHFNDENWIVDFYDVEVDSCGKVTNNSSGIFKDGTVDAGTWNAISFYNLTVEGCGSASSAAGGIRLVTDNANRGLYFYSPCVEGNFGTCEIFISNMADCQFYNLYMEVVSAQATNAVELSGVIGGFTGGYVTGDNIVTNLVGVKIRPGGVYVPNQIEFDKITIVNFAASIDSESAKIWTNQIHGNRTFADLSTSTQYFGDYSPRISAVKNATQTITTGSFQKVTFETEVYDLCGKFSGSTWTPQTIGTYQIDAGVRFTAGVDQARMIIAIYVRGAAVKSVAIECSGTGEQSVTISAQVDTQLINDGIEIYIRQDTSSDKTISAGPAETWFMGSLIGRIA
jgi:hypothetical protein